MNRYDRFTGNPPRGRPGPYDRDLGARRGGSYGRDYRPASAGRPRPGYARDFEPGTRDRARSASRPEYGGDYWWLGERAYERNHRGGRYDERYRKFDETHHPRYSPVGGTYPAMGGRYRYRRPPAPLREERWFSDWTRWF
jgi:hypothetical protein